MAWAPATLRVWTHGQAYRVGGERRFASPIIILPVPGQSTLSFVNLIEAHVLRALRTEHGFSMRAVKEALTELPKHSDSEHPLAFEDLLANSGQLFLDKYGELINSNRSSQLAIRDALESILKRIERDNLFAPIRLFPFIRSHEIEGPRTVSVDPRVMFGRPVISGTRIPTAEIRSRVDAGDTIEALAEDFGIETARIKDAIVYESRLAA